MEKLNTTTDTQKYLKPGKLTQNFLDENLLKEKVYMDYLAKIKQGKNVTKLDCLIAWIKHNIKTEKQDAEFVRTNKFQRTAKQIWESGKSTGCTDYAIVFCTLARQLGFPSTLLHTAQLEWLQKFKNDKNINYHSGHSFCECFYNGKWVLVDPTCNKITKNYYPKMSYSV